MRHLISILIITLCSTFCWAQGNDFSAVNDFAHNKEMLMKSREMFEKGSYDSALFYINKAELNKGKILVNPQLSADIHEQYSLVMSALGDKQQSDYHRNMYLDIKELARHDRILEKEADDLLKRSQWLSIKMTLLALAVLACIIGYVHYRKKFTTDEKTGEDVLNKKKYDEQAEELDEQLALLQHKLRTNKEQNVDKRTKLFLINTVSPLIARLRKAIDIKDNDYALEILSQIDQYNALLTDWIQLEQGRLSFKIETFAISELLEILKRNEKTFAMQGLKLEVGKCDTKVKADKILTLFMLNTLADNARKATQSGGTISILAEEKENYLELSVKDSGKGMSEEQAANIFSHTIVNGHGFGLLNCRGIINSYKKVGSLFNCCMMGVESELGKGSRFFFRLPLVKMILCLLMFTCISIFTAGNASARPTRYTERIHDELLRKAASYADSAFYSNIDGNYEQTIAYADSVQICLMQTMSDSLLMENISLDAANEAAVASLALQRWEDYRTYNSIYENNFRHLTSNAGLEEYCKNQTEFLDFMKVVWRIANILFFIVPISIFCHLRYLWLRRRKMLKYKEDLCLDDKKSMVRLLEYENESLHISNNILTNGLSTIKHETMYYPNRIASLLRTANSDKEEISNLTLFYEQLYNNLTQQLSNQKISTGIKLKRKCLGSNLFITTDTDLYSYLLTQIKKFLGVRNLDIIYNKEGIYTDVIINAENIDNVDHFAPTTKNIPLLICRQIMRDTSGQNSHGNGIIISNNRITLRFS